MDMLRYEDKPPKRRRKPTTKAMAQQNRAETLNRRARFAFTVFYGLAAAVIVGSAMAQTPMSGPTPQVGDVLSITAAATAPGATLADVPARLLTGPMAQPGQGCWLDEQVMRTPGGTLTVLAVRPDGIMLSWAGGNTARIASCPSLGQMLVSAAGYQALARIAVPERPAVVR
jgi:hypothetical protein